MITKKENMSGNINLSLSIAVAFLALIVCFVSTSYGDVILGNWEYADSNDNWVPGNDDLNAVLTPASTIGVTSGDGSLRLKPVDEKVPGGAYNAYWRLQWQGAPLDLTDASLQFDVTLIAAEWPSQPWTKIADKIAINSNGPGGWTEWDNLTVATNRDTGEDSTLTWGAWEGDANKTFTLDVSNYDATGATYMQIIVSVQDNNVFDGGYFYFDNFRLVTPAMTVSKAKVKAGKTQYHGDEDYNDMKDTFTASGIVVLPPDVNDINEVVVTITSNVDDEVIYTETLSDFNAAVVNSTGKYKHSARAAKGQAGKITSMTLDFRRGTFAIAAKNIDLTGLACSFEIKFEMGSYELKGNAYEAAVNGTKLIPTRLMRMYNDTLIVTKAKAKHTTTPAADTLSVKGDIAVADMNVDANEPNLVNEDVVLTWGDVNDTNTQTFVIPAGSFKASKKGHTYKCRKVEADANDGNEGFVTATIDLDKATFTVSVKSATGLYAEALGETVFGISFDTEEGTFDEEDEYTLP